MRIHVKHPSPDRAAARAFFERHFTPARILPERRMPGLVTGFYEPQVDASPVRTEEYSVPLLSRPADLVDVDDANRPAGMDPYLAFARQTPAVWSSITTAPPSSMARWPDRGSRLPGWRARSMPSSSMFRVPRGSS